MTDSKMKPQDIGPVQETTTAIALRDELADAREQLVKAEKKYNDGGAGGSLGGIGLVVGLLGGGMLLAMLLPAFPVIGSALLLGGAATIGIGAHINKRAQKKLQAARGRVRFLSLSKANEPAALKPDATVERPAPKAPDGSGTAPVPV